METDAPHTSNRAQRHLNNAFTKEGLVIDHPEACLKSGKKIWMLEQKNVRKRLLPHLNKREIATKFAFCWIALPPRVGVDASPFALGLPQHSNVAGKPSTIQT